VAGFAYGLFQVPYISLPDELTSDPDQRSRLQLARVVVLSRPTLSITRMAA